MRYTNLFGHGDVTLSTPHSYIFMYDASPLFMRQNGTLPLTLKSRMVRRCTSKEFENLLRRAFLNSLPSKGKGKGTIAFSPDTTLCVHSNVS